MKLTKEKTIGYFTIAIMLIITAIVQTHLKMMPQIVMLVLGCITFSTYFLKNGKYSKSFFYLLFSLLSFITFLYLLFKLVDILFPYKPSPTPKMDLMLLTIIPIAIAIVLTPISLFIYHKYVKQDLELERTVSLLFSIITLFIFIFFELIF